MQREESVEATLAAIESYVRILSYTRNLRRVINAELSSLDFGVQHEIEEIAKRANESHTTTPPSVDGPATQEAGGGVEG